jgi:long-subunit acyl-CoA synthetase (AMP-forming)
LAADGELLFAGPIVMRGYRNRPDATAEAIDADGWLHTGDIATIDADGYVTIVDRKKEIIINAAGKNMSPANIETTIRAAAPLIGQAVTIGDARNYVTALLVLDPEATARWAAGQGIDESSPKALCSDPRLLQVLAERVRIANDRLSRVEQIKRFRVLPDVWAPGDDVLTPTMKLRRREIAARYAAEIEEMYLPEPSPSVVSFGAEQDK